MLRDDTSRMVLEIFNDLFDDCGVPLNEDVSVNDIDEWDSLGHINIVSAVEREFEIKFTLEEIYEIKGVKQIVDLVFDKLN